MFYLQIFYTHENFIETDSYQLRTQKERRQKLTKYASPNEKKIETINEKDAITYYAQNEKQSRTGEKKIIFNNIFLYFYTLHFINWFCSLSQQKLTQLKKMKKKEEGHQKL